MESNQGNSTDIAALRKQLRANLHLTYTWLRGELQDFLAPFEVSIQQVSLLEILRASDKPLSTKQLAELMSDKNSDASRMVDRLVKKNLLRKRKNTSDRRLVQVSINYEGLKLLAQIEDAFLEKDAELFPFSAEKLMQLNTLLEKIPQSKQA